MKTILITGGSGFLGSNLALYLSKKYKIIIFDNLSRGKSIFLKRKNILFIKGDIKKYNQLKICSKYKIDKIIHLASINGTKFFYEKPIDVIETNILGTINIFKLAKRKKVKEILVASTSEVYVPPKKIPTPETETLKIENIFNERFSYSGSKILLEILSANYGKKYFKKMIIFRPHNVYGPNMGNEHVIPDIIKKIKNNSKILNIEGTGNETRSFIFIDDFVKSIDILLRKGSHLNVYNIGTNDEISIKNLIKVILTITNKKREINYIKLKKGSVKRRNPNISKIKKLGFRKRWSLYEGLKKTIPFYL